MCWYWCLQTHTHTLTCVQMYIRLLVWLLCPIVLPIVVGTLRKHFLKIISRCNLQSITLSATLCSRKRFHQIFYTIFLSVYISILFLFFVIYLYVLWKSLIDNVKTCYHRIYMCLLACSALVLLNRLAAYTQAFMH